MQNTTRARRNPRRLLAISALGIGLVAAACGSTAKKTDSTTTTAAATVSTTAAATTTTAGGGAVTTATTAGPTTTAAPSTAKPVTGGTLRVGTESNVSTLDPAQQLAQPADKDIALTIYDPLMSFDKDNKFAPFLAESLKNSDDLKVWTMGLRKGVKFTDGTDFNADAVIAHWKRMADPATGSPWATESAKATLSKTDDYTVVFTLAEGNVGFPNNLIGAMGYTPSPTAVAKDPTGFGLNPVGTGPFKISKFEAGGEVDVVKNPDYWGKDDSGNKLPYLDGITFRGIPDSDQRLNALKAGEVDMIQTADTSTVVQAGKESSLKVQKVTGSSSTVVLFNNKKAPTDDVRIRQALNLATDRAAINEAIYSGARVESYSAFALDSPFFNKATPVGKFNLDKAKELIKDYGKPVEVVLECIPTPEADQILQLLKEQWEAAGVKVTLSSQEQGAYVARIFGKGGDYQTACFRTNQFVEPDQIRGSLETDNAANLLFSSDPALDKALNDGRSSADFAKRQAAYNTVQDLLAKDIPALNLLYDLFGNITSKKVSDLPKPEGDSLGALKLATVFMTK